MLKLKIVEWQGLVVQSIFCEVANIEGCVTILFEKTSNYPHFFSTACENDNYLI